MRKIVFSLFIALIAFAIAPAVAAPGDLKLSNPMVAPANAKLGLTVATATTVPMVVAAAKTDKAKVGAKAKAEESKKSKKDKGELGATKK